MKRPVTSDFCRFMSQCAEELARTGHCKTASIYGTVLRSFKLFSEGRTVRLGRMDAWLVHDYEQWLLGRHLALNTVSLYMRVLRAVYNRAACKGLAPARHPFGGVYTGVDKTVKRAVDMETLDRLSRTPLPPRLAFARDVFMLGFYLRGMAFADLAYLRKQNVAGDYLTYSRKKTGRVQRVRLENCMREIIDRYAGRTAGTDYLLPILCNVGYDSALRLQNKRLARISRIMRLEPSLTTYVARHSWASAAWRMGIPLTVISESMGHDNEETTRIYLASLDQAVLDRANRRLVSPFAHKRETDQSKRVVPQGPRR